MPFIVQCPHPDCQKHMLLEDHVRGTVVECMVCRKTIQLDPSGSGERTKPPPVPGSAALPVAKREKIAACPKCSTPLRLPPAEQGQSIKCPVCKDVFVLP